MAPLHSAVGVNRWSFSESKLMVAFRAPPDVKWDIAARVFGLELPNWLEV